MLKSLTIRNYALIENLEIDFNSGFSIITGETGAGKSILLGALSLILGERADTSTLKKEDEKCVVEGVFDIKNYNLEKFFQDNIEEAEYETETIIRRIILPSGKSRAFVNDTPVTLTILKDLGLKLVDIHSQHKNLMLADNSFQLNVLDSFAQHANLLENYKKIYKDYQKALKAYKNLQSKAEKTKADFDYYQHRFEKLNAAQLKENEQDELENELETLNHAEEIQLNLSAMYKSLSGDDEMGNVISLLKTAVQSGNKISSYLPKIADLAQRMESAQIELEDIASETELLASEIEYKPDRAEFVKQRLDTIYSLQQSHRVSSIKELLTIKDNLETKLNEIENFDFHLEELKKNSDKLQHQLAAEADKITQNRQKQIPALEKKITGLLNQLGMPNATFIIKHEKSKDFTPLGRDIVVFLFSANKNVTPLELNKVASGGEISRLMLTIKSLISQSMALPTIIFDEIDAGVSGDIAGKMGNIMKKMSSGMQVLAITHLPQVAAKGDCHYKVFKNEDAETTRTLIKELNNEARLLEIAKMLSGENISDAAMINAKALLEK